MQVLKYIEDRFESLSIRVKIELFLFPFIVFFLFIYIMDENRSMKSFDKKIEFLDIENLQMNENFVDILKNIEKFAKENSIHLENISNTNNSVKIEANANIKNRIKLLEFLENYNSFSKLRDFEIIDDKLLVEIAFNKFYKKEKINISDSLEFFENEKIFIYKLKAIVGKKALINDTWLNKEDRIGQFKVFEINSKSVVLKNSYKTLVLKLYKNENI